MGLVFRILSFTDLNNVAFRDCFHKFRFKIRRAILAHDRNSNAAIVLFHFNIVRKRSHLSIQNVPLQLFPGRFYHLVCC